MAAIPQQQAVTCRVYRRRWIMLAIFMAFNFLSTGQWVQYSIIADVVMKYYGVSSYAVDWTAIVFTAVYVLCVIPATYLFDRSGLRVGMLVGVALMTVGTWIKCASVAPSRFAVTFAGQTLVGISQAFVLSVPPFVASAWFGSTQISTACALGLMGMQLGIATFFVSMPMMVQNHENLDDVGSDLQQMSYIVAGLCTALLLITVALFQEKPPLPPSVEAMLQGQNKSDFLGSLRRLLRNSNFRAYIISYGPLVGVFNAFSTLLNQLILVYFLDGQEFAGRVGLVFVMTGLGGSVLCGVFLDKTHFFRETIVATYALSTASLLVLTFMFAFKSQLLVYLIGGAFGVFMGAYMTVSFEYGVELTYPESPNTASAVLLLSSQLQSVIITVLYGWLFKKAGDVWANVVLTIFMAIGTIATVLIRPELRRQAAHASLPAGGIPTPLHAANAEADSEVPEAVKLMNE